jgi:hypothetical protein
MKKYKLTDQDIRTHNGFQWELGKEVITDGENEELCNKHWLHYYHHPLLAVLLNPIHAKIDNPRLFEVKALGKHLNDNGLKGGCTKMTLVKEIELPEITLNQQIAFGILCSLAVYKESTYILWANDWLNNVDRSAARAYAAANAASNANAAADAAYAAYAAADAADAARYAACAAAAAAAARYAAAAAAARYAAADAAADANIDLIKLAKKAFKYK